MAAFQVLTQDAFDHPEIGPFLLRAVEANKAPNPEEVLQEVRARLNTDPYLAVFVGVDEAGKFGMSVLLLPSSHFAPGPQVLSIYNEGAHSTVRELIEEMKKFVEMNGHKKLVGINLSGRDDAVWARAFRAAGPATMIGTWYEFQWGD